MTRILQTVLVAFALSLSAPALACGGKDCADCPNCHKGEAVKSAAKKDAPPCACSQGKECKCPKGCTCDHCAAKKDDKKATSKT